MRPYTPLMSTKNIEKKILEKLSQIIDPDLNQNIVALGFIKNLRIKDQNAAFDIQLTTPACPVKDMFKKEAESLVLELDEITSVDVTMTAQPRQGLHSNQKNGLANVKHILAVSSCKGGVGKSSVAVNLAYSISKLGAKVGIFDADVYGPSLPTMVKFDDIDLEMENNLVVPLEFNGVKLMSFGYSQQMTGDTGPAVLRGPMVSQVVNQLLTGTQWGDLDYLILDMPPGTGDIQLTIAQILPLTAAVIVTTPQELSFVDVVKGIRMFDNLEVPCIAVVENMAYFQYEPDGEKFHIFGKGVLNKLVSQFGFEHSFSFPLVPELAKAGDQGTPFVLLHEGSVLESLYQDLAKSVVREISKNNFYKREKPEIDYTEAGFTLLIDGKEYGVTAKVLREACPCAKCVDEFTGEKYIKSSDIPDTLHPENMSPVGNYAFGINWTDGHSSLFPYATMIKVAEPRLQTEPK